MLKYSATLLTMLTIIMNNSTQYFFKNNQKLWVGFE